MAEDIRVTMPPLPMVYDGIDVLRVRDGRIAEVTTFGAALFPELDLPPALSS